MRRLRSESGSESLEERPTKRIAPEIVEIGSDDDESSSSSSSSGSESTSKLVGSFYSSSSSSSSAEDDDDDDESYDDEAVKRRQRPLARRRVVAPPVRPLVEKSERDRAVEKMYRALKPEIDILPQQDRDFLSRDEIPETVTPTYGELTIGSFNKILAQFERLGMTSSSTFLDIGSGYGRPVFHAAIKMGVRAHGIEYIPMRVQKSQEFIPRIEKIWPGVSALVSFAHGDITKETALNFDFIYFYDIRNGPELIKPLEELLLRSRFKYFVSYKRPSNYPKLHYTGMKVEVSNTGGEHSSAYFYTLPQ